MDNKSYLAVETKPNNYFPIDLLDLKITPGYTIIGLDELDNFTLKYTIKEIRESIKEANLLEINNDMPLVVIYNEKNSVRKAMPLTKDNNYDMYSKLRDKFSDKSYLNNIYNFLNNKIDSVELSKLKNSSNIEEFLTILASLPYLTQRKLYLYLYEK